MEGFFKEDLLERLARLDEDADLRWSLLEVVR